MLRNLAEGYCRAVTNTANVNVYSNILSSENSSPFKRNPTVNNSD